MQSRIQSREFLASGCELVEDVARIAGVVRLRVTGSSMAPAIWPGDTITVQRRDFSDLKPGKIILCRNGEGVVAHRIVEIREQWITTQGDSLQTVDPCVDAAHVIGEVVSIVHNGRQRAAVLSPWQRAGSSILRKSDFCLRMMLRIRRLRNLGRVVHD